MPRFPVSPEKQARLEEAMARLRILEADLVEEFVRGSGPGGQKINKSSVVVQLAHPPSGISVRCQEGRSQAMNRFLARRLLVEKVDERLNAAASVKQQAIEKIRRQKRKRSKRAKEKMLRDKKKQTEKKNRRRPLKGHDEF